MKKFTILTLLLLILGGISTLTSFYMIMQGIDNLDTFSKVLNIGIVSSLFLMLGIICVNIKVVIRIYRHFRKKE